MMEGIILNEIQNILYMLKVERNFSEYTLKSYHDDLVQFNEFLNSEHLELTTFEYKDARNYLSYLYSNNLKGLLFQEKFQHYVLSMNIG